MTLRPWKRRREEAERSALAAEGKLEAARLENERVKKLAAAARARRQQNGFADMIKLAMGVDEHGTNRPS